MTLFLAIVTFNFSDDELRDEFIDLLEQCKFNKEDDKSTYALPHKENAREAFLAVSTFHEVNNERFEFDDFIDYYAVMKLNEKPEKAIIKKYSFHST
jgi:hypothetical protein